MGSRYRKSINLGGGVRMNVSKSGIGFSAGVKGARVTRTARGTTRTTLSVPGTGLSYVSETGKGSRSNHSSYAEYKPTDRDIQDPQPFRCCRNCNSAVFAGAKFCSNCGMFLGGIPDPWDDGVKYNNNIKERKSWLVTLLLCLFLGWLGAHRFYTRRYVSAVFYVLTCGWWGIGALVDLVVIICHKFTDADGNPLE